MAVCTCWRDGGTLTTTSEAECAEHRHVAWEWDGLRGYSDERLLDLLAMVRAEVRRRDPGPPSVDETREYRVLSDVYDEEGGS